MSLGGRPLVSYALEALRNCREIDEIVLVVAAEDVERARREGLLRTGGRQSERVVAGGSDREASVRAGLAEVSPTCETVLVHDGARPFLSEELLQRCIEASAAHDAVLAAVPATDTLKQVGEEGTVSATLDRSQVWTAQTPQIFRRELLEKAHEKAAAEGTRGTDDACLVEQMGHPVHVVMGETSNIKITYAADLALAESVVRRGRQKMNDMLTTRVGIGYDAHRFGADRPLVLGGVTFHGEVGLVGHSDADVICHAVCDALLGALGAGDIGQHFPPGDPRYAGINSLSLLERVASMVRSSGWGIGNIDVVVIAEAPRIAPHVPAIREALAGAMGIASSGVSVKGKTTEGMGFAGRGEGIAGEAVCMIHRSAEGEAGSSEA